jgi:hypothetical protein
MVVVQKTLLLKAIRKPGEIEPVFAMSLDFHKMLAELGPGPSEALVLEESWNI